MYLTSAHTFFPAQPLAANFSKSFGFFGFCLKLENGSYFMNTISGVNKTKQNFALIKILTTKWSNKSLQAIKTPIFQHF